MPVFLDVFSTADSRVVNLEGEVRRLEEERDAERGRASEAEAEVETLRARLRLVASHSCNTQLKCFPPADDADFLWGPASAKLMGRRIGMAAAAIVVVGVLVVLVVGMRKDASSKQRYAAWRLRGTRRGSRLKRCRPASGRGRKVHA